MYYTNWNSCFQIFKMDRSIEMSRNMTTWITKAILKHYKLNFMELLLDRELMLVKIAVIS